MSSKTHTSPDVTVSVMDRFSLEFQRQSTTHSNGNQRANVHLFLFFATARPVLINPNGKRFTPLVCPCQRLHTHTMHLQTYLKWWFWLLVAQLRWTYFALYVHIPANLASDNLDHRPIVLSLQPWRSAGALQQAALTDNTLPNPFPVASGRG